MAVVRLAEVEETNARALAAALHLEPTRLHALMTGDGRDYSRALSPVALGLAGTSRRGRHRIYRATAESQAVARILRSRPVVRAMLDGLAPPGAFV